MSPREVYRKLMRKMRTGAIVIKSPNNKNNNGPLAPLLKTIDYQSPPGLSSANMGPYSQATTEATKSIVDM